jgi:acyl-CoA synthetase (AMP-forming)/AMP-acid ligase II
MSAYRATMTVAPDFAYNWCSRLFDEARLRSCDLSSLTCAFNAADMVREETILAFARTFGPLGFSQSAMIPGYGLAEATLYVSSGQWRKGRIPGTPNRSAISSGIPSPEIEVAIVDPATRQLVDQGVGEVWLRGDTVARGYWNDDTRTKEVFGATIVGQREAPYLRTGDLGYVDSTDGCLFICGRIKNQIVRYGRNYEIEDIEGTIAACDERIRPLGVAVAQDSSGDTDDIVVIVEATADAAARRNIVDMVRRQVAISHDLRLDVVRIVEPGFIRKTTSGKIQRAETLERLRNSYGATE